MAVRNFDGTGDYIDFPIPAALDVTGAVTIVAVLKRGANGAWHAPITWQDSADSYSLGLDLSNTNTPVFACKNTGGTEGSVSIATTVQAADGWVIVVATHTVGTGGGISVYKAGAWTHNLGQSGLPTPKTSGVGTGKIRVGRFQNTDDYNGRLAAIAVWKGTELTQAQIESLDGGSISAWSSIASGPTEHWEFDQAAWATQVVGEKGVASSSSISGNGTIVTGDDPGPTIYTLTGGAGGTTYTKTGLAIVGP